MAKNDFRQDIAKPKEQASKVKVKMVKQAYIDRLSYMPGAVIEVSSEIAAQLIASGAAENINKEG